MTSQYQNNTINSPGLREVFPETRLTVDVSTTAVDPVFTPIPVDQTIVTSGGLVEIGLYPVTTSDMQVPVVYRILVDGQVVFSRGAPAISGFPIPAIIMFTTQLPAGEHLVQADFAKQAGSPAGITVSIPAATQPTSFSTNMIIAEFREYP